MKRVLLAFFALFAITILATQAVVMIDPYRLHVTPSGFQPSDISGLQTWLSDTGSDPATWPDLSGGGNDATQSDSSKQPSIQLGFINGHQARQFDGVNDYLITSLSVAQPFSVFFVSVTSSPSATQDVVYSSTQNSGFDIIGGQNFGYAGGVIFGATSVASIAHITDWIISSGAGEVYVDGTLDGSGTIGSNPFDVIYIGSYHGFAEFFNGYIAEVIIYNSALSGTDRHKVETYLGTKYGITVP